MASEHQERVDGQRVCIYISVQSIPGSPSARPFTLGEIFCQIQFGRELNLYEDSHSIDDLHIPGGFDSENDVKRWFVYDLGVRQTLDSSEHHRILHEPYRGCRLDDGTLKFVPCPQSRETLTRYLKSYRWVDHRTTDGTTHSPQQHDTPQQQDITEQNIA
ncbi:Hypothetical protein R9X50_00093500 [Acrodontium crateriforme]|uniref:Uncharacterized protein n=1 Tax=Acrodontium crateriforme TaxID=150365 RepID=A0AAQ3LYH0_9PEZI|nr:Hypothetical protein R9X50_00093500 [Acrodontium crateriforme]